MYRLPSSHPGLTFVGDVHGKTYQFNKILHFASCPVVQVGDFGFEREFRYAAKQPHFWMLGGNHDDYDNIGLLGSKWLGDYGPSPFAPNAFHVRGAWSIDRDQRTVGINWWEEEQITYRQAEDALDSYGYFLPELMVTHDCPLFLYPRLGCKKIYRTLTAELLNDMFIHHRPKTWVFGHHHKSFRQEIGGCLFVGLGELETFDIPPSPGYNPNAWAIATENGQFV